MKIGVVPRYAELLDNELFRFEQYTPLELYGVDRPGFDCLQSQFSKMGHEIGTVDNYRLSELDLVMFIDTNFYYLDRLLSMRDPPKLVYVMREAPSAVPFNSTASLLANRSLFDRILTWNDDLAAQTERAVKYDLPYRWTDNRADERADFDDRTLLTNVSSRKYSQHPNELYTARKNVVRYYERHHPEQFDLYGRGWNDPPSPMEVFRGNFSPETFETYGGLIDDKVETYHDYRFAVCFENQSDIPGWITEKIFDCFRAGTVPVYWGASNIEEYVPPETFVDYREFASPAELHDYLASVSAAEFEEYVAAAQSFLAESDLFTPERFAQQFGDALLSTPETDDTVPADLREWVTERAHLDRMMWDPRRVPKLEYVRRYVSLLRSNPKLLAETPQATYFGLRRLLPGDLGEIR